MNIFERPLQEEPVDIFSAPAEVDIFSAPEEETIVWGDSSIENSKDATNLPLEDLLDLASTQLEAEDYDTLSEMVSIVRKAYVYGF